MQHKQDLCGEEEWYDQGGIRDVQAEEWELERIRIEKVLRQHVYHRKMKEWAR